MQVLEQTPLNYLKFSIKQKIRDLIIKRIFLEMQQNIW